MISKNILGMAIASVNAGQLHLIPTSANHLSLSMLAGKPITSQIVQAHKLYVSWETEKEKADRFAERLLNNALEKLRESY